MNSRRRNAESRNPKHEIRNKPKIWNSNVSNAGSWANTKIIAGVKNESIALAEQIVSVEAYRPESSFSDAVKGLHVYGGKIIRPDMTCVLYADYTAES